MRSDSLIELRNAKLITTRQTQDTLLIFIRCARCYINTFTAHRVELTRVPPVSLARSMLPKHVSERSVLICFARQLTTSTVVSLRYL